MSSTKQIAIFVDKNGRNELAGRIDRNLITKHSKAVRSTLEEDSKAENFVITTAAKGPVALVLELIKNARDVPRISIGHEPFEKGVAILQAVNALDMDPEQPQVENHVIYALTQFTITARQVFVIAEASDRLGTDCRVYKATVQAVAYNFLHSKFTQKDAEEIKNVARKYPDLNDAVQEKIEDLKKRKEEHERMIAQKNARLAAQEAEEFEGKMRERRR